MSDERDDLDELLSDVQKVIRDNEMFLKTLMDDAIDSNDGLDEAEEVIKDGEGEFEEL